MKILSRINIIIILCILILGTKGQNAAGVTLLKNGEAHSSELKSQNIDALKKGCELTVHINDAHYEEGFNIYIKKDFYQKTRKIEKAVLIEVLEQHRPVTSSQVAHNNEANGDTVLYVKHKDSTEPFIRHWYIKDRRFRVQMGKDKFLKYEFSYDELINVIEQLIYKDKLTLTGDTISVKKRVFKELDGEFFLKWYPPHFYNPKNN